MTGHLHLIAAVQLEISEQTDESRSALFKTQHARRELLRHTNLRTDLTQTHSETLLLVQQYKV